MKVALVAVILFLSTGIYGVSWADSGNSGRAGRAGYAQKDAIVRDRSDIYDGAGGLDRVPGCHPPSEDSNNNVFREVARD